MRGIKFVGMLLCFTAAIFDVFTEAGKSETWPPESHDVCTQSTKQKAMYGSMIFKPSLRVNPMVKMSVKVKWNELKFSPHNPHRKGGVYIAYTIGTRDGPGGYFGTQIKGSGGSFLFSIWDADRWTGSGSTKQIKKSSKLTWPLNLNRCHRNCQDCGLRHLRDLKREGFTTGTQCNIKYPSMKAGDKFELTFERTRKQKTINTADYGGMPRAHAKIHEVDREVTGSVWMVKAVNLKTDEEIEVGKMLFEGDDDGMVRLGTFDEMLGCNPCNQIYHKDTRYDLQIEDYSGNKRRPTEMRGMTKWGKSTCKDYYIGGSKRNDSIMFESGPLTKNTFYTDDKMHTIWKK